jgi:hypothetical protein
VRADTLRRVRRALLPITLLFVLASCSDGEEAAPAGDAPFPTDAFAYSGSSNMAVGTERVLIAVAAPDGSRLASPEIPVRFELYHEEAPEDRISVDADFIWAVPGVSGLYRATVTFDRPGIWEVVVVPEGAEGLEPAPMSVLPEPLTPGVGDPAPRSATVTSADVDSLDEITTDPDPEPGFYEVTVADAVTSGRPAVIVFATPAFCQTATCGPTLDVAKEVAPSYPDVHWVHVEVYTNLDDPDGLEVVPSVEEWGLPTEPWVFVVDAAGIVTHRFEGVITSAELRDALEEASAG